MENDVALGTNGFINGQYNYNPAVATPTIGTGNLYAPTVLASIPGFPAHGPQYKSGKIFSQSIITGDTLHFNRQWALQAVLSTASIHSSSFNPTGATTSSTGANANSQPDRQPDL